MSTHNICYREEIRKIAIFLMNKIALSGAMIFYTLSEMYL